MDVLNFIVNQIFGEAPIFLGLIALTGLLLQKKDAQDVITGTAKTIIGILILNAGMNVFLGSLLPITDLLSKSVGVVGIMPDNFGPLGIVLRDFPQVVSLTLALGFFIHIFLVKIVKNERFKNVFLTGHVMINMAAWFVIIFTSTLTINNTWLIILSGIFTGIVFTVLPAWAKPYTQDITEGEFTLGHMQTFNIVGGSWVGKLFKGTKRCEDIELPGLLSVFSDYSILLSVLMPVMYIVIGLFVGPEVTSKLSGNSFWIKWLIIQGITFAAGVMVVLYGVRLFLSAIIPAFKGISERVIPGATPALDSPLFFPYAPVATIMGFLSDAAVAILITVILVAIKAPIVVVPGPIFVFFEGALAGVFGDRFGGWKGAVAGGALMGLITHLGAIPLYYLQTGFQGSGLVFGGADLVLLSPILYLIKFIGGLMGVAL
ncbi:MAG TPA: PTS ascorbate transporter subunit IIC [Clostridia bacterium]|nr:PTS ascorbate transporter subunit IIC [Clostridia bacterium]